MLLMSDDNIRVDIGPRQYVGLRGITDRGLLLYGLEVTMIAEVLG